MKVHKVAPAPVHISAKPLKNWSGKEDSNLRPLPPEGASPTRTPRISVTFPCMDSALDALCSRTVPARGSLRTFGPCLTTTAGKTEGRV